MKTIATTLLFCLSFYAYAQVGVGTTNPDATLDIEASNVANPASNDGILIPRIDDFPSVNPTANQDGMMVFVTGNGTPTKGFYYWDNGASNWISVKGSDPDVDFYEIGTTSNPDQITDDIYTLGRLKIGQNSTATASLNIYDWNASNSSAFYVTRSLNSPSTSGQFSGAYITIDANTTDNYFGVQSVLSGSTQAESANFSAQAFGTFNSFTNLFSGRFYSTGGTGRLYGAKVSFLPTVTNTGNKYGYNVNIPSSLSGTHYGLYADVQSITGYAGYFIGRTSLGDGFGNRYLMPASDGSNGQVMTTDGAGNVTFEDLPTIVDTDEQNLGSNIVTANEEVEITITNGTNTIINIQDADADISNETITAAALSGTDLEITEAGSTTIIDLSSLQDGDTQNTLDQAYDEGGAGAGRIITADNGALLIDGFDGFEVSGTLYSGNVIPNSTGTKMFFNPRTASFRAGRSWLVPWDNTTTGIHSAAFGFDALASGDYSFAAGSTPEASGNYSISIGNQTVANGINSTAIGYQTLASGNYSMSVNDRSEASGYGAFAAGQNTLSSGLMSFVSGNGSQATGQTAFASGAVTTASGSESAAFNRSTDASGNFSFATGDNTTASGDNSASFGLNNEAFSLGEFVIGLYASTYTGFDQSNFNSNDRLFSIGNGTATTSRSNALTIYKSGLMNINDSYNMPLADGTANQVMTTDGSGNLTFQDVVGDGDTQNTLDEAYDEGGSGTGRIVTVDSGPIEFNGTSGTSYTQVLSNDNAGDVLNIISTGVVPEYTSTIAIELENDITTNNNNGNNYGVFNKMSVNGTRSNANHIGFRNWFLPAGSTNSQMYGFYNNSQNGGTGDHYGFYNRFSTDAGSGTMYGFYNIINSAHNNTKYGLYSAVVGALGTNYAVYAEASDNPNSWAGYFIGRMSLGNSTSTGRYLMPLSDGTAGQVMTTDGAGNVSFEDSYAGDSDWFEIGTTNPPDAINDNKFTGGNIAIGKNTIDTDSKVDIENSDKLYTLNLNNATNFGSAITGIKNRLTNNTSELGMVNDLEGNAPFKVGMQNNFIGSASSTMNHYGSINAFNSEGNAFQTGLRNQFTSNNNTGTNNGVYNLFASDNYSGTLRGTYNAFSGNSTAIKYGLYNSHAGTGTGVFYGSYTTITNTGSSDKYGHNVTIPSTAGGTHYGFYADVQKASGYAGYFIGRTSFGNTTSNRYTMPASDGTIGQVLTTDGIGNTSWQNLPSSSMSLARITMSTDQSITSSAWQKLNFDTVDFDLNSEFNTTTDEFEVTSTGYYRINASWRSTNTSTSTSAFGIAIVVNGVFEGAVNFNNSGSGYVFRSINRILDLNAGDSIEIQILNTGPIDVFSNDIVTSFEIEQIR